MKKILLVISLLHFIQCGKGQLLVNDNFADRTKFIDNTLLTIWGPNAIPSTGFLMNPKSDVNGLSFNAISLTSDAVSHSGYTAANSLKTLTSIDYELPLTIDRITDTITIEFDAIWDATSSSGENGRMVVTLMDSYPAGGAVLNQVDDISLSDPFGKPLYNIRIRNNPGASTNGPLMLYGAGITPQPEWEKYGTGPWWLPGFSVQAGGGSPGTGPNYPLSGTMKSNTSIVSTTIWKHYTWRIFPERMELYSRNTNQAPAANTLSLFMQIPRNLSPAYVQGELLAAHGNGTLPPNYDWFRYANAVRFYWRGSVNSHLANVEIRRTAATTLPIEKITDLKAQAKDKYIYLSGTLQLTDNYTEAEVQHSLNGYHFNKISTLTARHIKQDKFQFKHENPSEGKNYYRIKIDHADRESYTDIVVAEIRSTNKYNLYPNPGNGTFYINTPGGNKSLLKIYDPRGVEIYSQWLDNGTPVNLVKKQGIYFYTISDDTQILKSGQLVIQ